MRYVITTKGPTTAHVLMDLRETAITVLVSISSLEPNPVKAVLKISSLPPI